MRKIYKISVLMLFCLFLLSLTSCSQIEDQNGEDDKSLVTITDDDIIKGKKGIVKFKCIVYESNNNTTIKCEKISGVESLKVIKPKGKTIKIKTNFNVLKGNARMVLIKNKEIVYDFSLEKEDVYVIENSDDTFRLVIACESAKIDLLYSVDSK